MLEQFSVSKAILRQKGLMRAPQSKQLIKDNRSMAKMQEKTLYDFRLYRNFKVKQPYVNKRGAVIF